MFLLNLFYLFCTKIYFFYKKKEIWVVQNLLNGKIIHSVTQAALHFVEYDCFTLIESDNGIYHFTGGSNEHNYRHKSD